MYEIFDFSFTIQSTLALMKYKKINLKAVVQLYLINKNR